MNYYSVLPCLAAFLALAGAFIEEPPPLTGKTFVFYYLWYGNPEANGRWQHWNHEVLPHWTDAENQRHPTVGTRHSPPGQLHAPFYPQRGPYSSTDSSVLDAHFAELKAVGSKGGGEVVAVLSWWGQASREGTSDTQGISTDDRVEAALAAAARQGVACAWHLEPYPGRSAASVMDDVAYLEAKYGSSPGLARVGPDNQDPVYFVYDSYHIADNEWRAVLLPSDDSEGDGGNSPKSKQTKELEQQQQPVGRRRSVRGVFVGLWLDREHGASLARSGFDAFYTYFASGGFSYGSSPQLWPRMVQEARQLGLSSVLSVGPGYVDDRIRPWNAHNTKARQGGKYYAAMCRAALEAKPDALSVTSYNEWGEGTQIEPARAESGYLDYQDAGGPDAYLNLTAKAIAGFQRNVAARFAYEGGAEL